MTGKKGGSKRARKPDFKVDARKIRPEEEEKTAMVVFRVSRQEQRQMMEMAKRLGVSLSEYLRQLHRQAVESLEEGDRDDG